MTFEHVEVPLPDLPLYHKDTGCYHLDRSCERLTPRYHRTRTIRTTEILHEGPNPRICVHRSCGRRMQESMLYTSILLNQKSEKLAALFKSGSAFQDMLDLRTLQFEAGERFEVDDGIEFPFDDIADRPGLKRERARLREAGRALYLEKQAELTSRAFHERFFEDVLADSVAYQVRYEEWGFPTLESRRAPGVLVMALRNRRLASSLTQETAERRMFLRLLAGAAAGPVPDRLYVKGPLGALAWIVSEFHGASHALAFPGAEVQVVPLGDGVSDQVLETATQLLDPWSGGALAHLPNAIDVAQRI